MRKVLFPVLVLLLVVTWLRPPRSEGVVPSFVFPISVSGKAFTTNLSFPFKPGKVNDKILGAILRGENTDDESVPFLDILHSDPSGRFFVYFDGRNADGTTSWRVATNPNGVMVTTINGAMTQDGVFWLAGTYAVPVMGTVADAFVNGQVKFAKGTFTPVKITGTLNFVSNVIFQSFTLKFKTVGKPTSVP